MCATAELERAPPSSCRGRSVCELRVVVECKEGKSPAFLRLFWSGSTSPINLAVLQQRPFNQNPTHFINHGERASTSNLNIARAVVADTHHSWSLLISVVVVVAFCAVSWFFSPKGETRTYVPSMALPSALLAGRCAESERLNHGRADTTCSVWRSTLLLAACSCWLMWGKCPAAVHSLELHGLTA